MPATPTYVAITEITLASSVASVTLPFPTGYRDIILISNFNGATAGDVLVFRLNGDSGSNYSGVGMRGNGSTTYSGTWSTAYGILSAYGGFTSTFEVNIAQFMDYSATDKHKTVLTRSNISDSKTEANVNRWASTSAITSINIYAGSGNLVSGSTFVMYGIEA